MITTSQIIAKDYENFICEILADFETKKTEPDTTKQSLIYQIRTYIDANYVPGEYRKQP